MLAFAVCFNNSLLICCIINRNTFSPSTHTSTHISNWLSTIIFQNTELPIAMSCFSSCFGSSSNRNERNFNGQLRKIKVHNFDQVDHTITENFKMSPKMVKRLGNINVCNIYMIPIKYF